MPETTQVYIGFLALIPSLAYSFAYSVGGRDEAPFVRPRIWKRFIAPVLFVSLTLILLICLSKFKIWYLTAYPAYIGAHFLMGYGGDKLWVKLGRRFLSGLVIGLAGSSIAVFAKSYDFLLMQVCLAILAHMVLGVVNPTKAPYEEALISLLTVIFVPYMGI